MIAIAPQMRILVAVEPADLRKGIDGLAAVCRKVLQQDPFSGCVFVFRNRRATALRILVYDGQGFWLCQAVEPGAISMGSKSAVEGVRQLEARELLREHLPDRFEREVAALCGLLRLRKDDRQVLLFSRLAEAVEITVFQRRVPRWEPAGIISPAGTILDDHAVRRPAPEPPEQPEPPLPTLALLSFDEVRADAYTRFLPLIGALAAGQPFSDFDIADLESASDGPWIEVLSHLAGRNRFVIRSAGDSLEPELRVGDLAVFEYHCTPRAQNQIVIANLQEFGLTSDLSTTDAVKRLRREADAWVFQSKNPKYEDIRVPAAECRYPILGILVGRMSLWGSTRAFVPSSSAPTPRPRCDPLDHGESVRELAKPEPPLKCTRTPTSSFQNGSIRPRILWNDAAKTVIAAQPENPERDRSLREIQKNTAILES
jgi:SOS-response transcriptional repressor LexA